MNTPPNREVALFSAALALPASQRAAYLDEACADDPTLRLRLEALLRDHEAAGAFLETPPPGAQGSPIGAEVTGATVRLSRSPAEKAGDRIGRYKLLQQIGEGGCGVVYMAEQEEPVRRRVALKVIKLGMDTKQVVARFEAERQALALMDHPNIAKVLDAGATDTGRPFFVMELVRGIKITDYCDENHLSTEQRLRLFVQVCQAIQHAHQKGIIHRDIKPSNILVADHDGVPVPKIIDFGIAKATTDQRLTDKTLFTAFEQFIGTPAYMSPEQAKLSGLDIDTRSDIYSLGVLLYELLTGKTPFDSKALMQAGLDEIRRTIREQDPVRPSTRLTQELVGADVRRLKSSVTGGPPSEEEIRASSRRLLQVKELIHLLRGDLDCIVMKCLEKERARRYESANGLARDIQRHLNCEPVVARPPSRLYEFQKTVRRHKFGFAAAVALITVLAVGALVSTLEAIRATRAHREQTRLRRVAETKEKKSEQVAKFLTDMLKGVGPSVALGRDTTMLREIVDKTAQRIPEDLKAQPEVQIELNYTLADTYHELGQYKAMEEMAREALRVARASLGEENLAVADALGQLGDALMHLRIQDQAESICRQAVAMERKVHGGESLGEADALYNLASVLQNEGKLIEAETAARQALAMRKTLLGAEHLQVARSLDCLSYVLRGEQRLPEAEALARESLAIRKKLFGTEHPDFARSFSELGGILAEQGKLAEAETWHREALAMQRRMRGEDNPYVATALDDLVGVLRRQRKLAEVETLYREQLARRRKLLGNDHPDVARALHDLAVSLVTRGKLPEAEPLFREAQEIWRQHPDPAIQRAKQATEADPENVHRWHDLGVACFNSGKWQAAIAAFEKCNQLGGSAWQWFFLAMAHWQLGDRQEARKWFYESLGWIDAVKETRLRRPQAEAAALLGLPDPGERSEKASSYLKQGDAYQRQGEMESAKAAYGQAIGHYETLVADFPAVPAYQIKLGSSQLRLADALRAGGQRSQAEQVLREVSELGDAQTLNGLAWLLATGPDPKLRDGSNAVAYAEKAVAATSRTNISYLGTLAAAYAEAGQFAKAISNQQEAIALSQSEQEKQDLASRLKLYENNSPYREHGSLAELTRDRLREGKFAEAEGLARECLALREREIPDDWRTFNARSMLGGSLLGQKKYAEAEPLLLLGYEGMKQRQIMIPLEGKPRLRETLERLVQLYEATNRPDQAAGWKQKLAEFGKTEK